MRTHVLPLPYRFEVPPRPESVAQARRDAAEALLTWGVGDARKPGPARDAVLIVSELVTNGFHYGEGEVIGVSIELQHDRLRIEVYDGSDTIPAPAGTVPAPADTAEDGRGLILVELLAESVMWEKTARGKRVVVEMTR